MSVPGNDAGSPPPDDASRVENPPRLDLAEMPPRPPKRKARSVIGVAGMVIVSLVSCWVAFLGTCFVTGLALMPMDGPPVAPFGLGILAAVCVGIFLLGKWWLPFFDERKSRRD